MKLDTTQPTQPIDHPQITSPIDTPTELLLYLTLLLTIGTNTLKGANHFLTELKKLQKQWRSKKPNQK